MKIVIYVDYSNSNISKDFNAANMLIENGHNVFFAINDEQFDFLQNKCERSVIGYSFNGNINLSCVEELLMSIKII